MKVKHCILTYLFRISLLIILAGALYLPASAQQFPVRVQVQCIPPFTPQLAGLYTGTQPKLIVTLINTDLQKPALNVRLRFNIKGSTVALRNRDYGYYPPISLDAGLPVQLSLTDLAPYFNPDNLEVSGMSKAQLQQNGQLPDGYYTICAEAVEVNSGQLVSNEKQGCSPPMWLSVSEPPLLNLPRKGEAVAFREPLNIIFNWTPRHMSSPNAAFQTEYEFTLVEVWDNGILPEAAFGTMPPLYQNTVNSTTMLYGPSEPPLLPGKQYAWRIRAKAKQGLDELAVFRNNGYSEIFYFRLQEDCQPPEQVAAVQEDGRIKITWAPQPKMFEYIVEYREQGNDNAEWFNVKSTTNTANIVDVIPGHKYEYRVGGYCSQGNKTLGETHGFEVPKKDTVDKNCGILPDLSITNQTPIQDLQPDDQITAGDFPVRLLQVEGSGSFTGNGYITIPFLGYNRVKVKFENITVNTDRQLINGVIMTTYDPRESQVVDVDTVVNAIGNLASILNALGRMTIDMDYTQIHNLIDSVREEAPPEVDDQISLESDELETSKQQYDDAREAYENATTPEEKAKAKEAMDAAAASFSDALANITSLLTSGTAAPPRGRKPVDVKFTEFATQNAGFDPNTFKEYPTYDTLKGKPIPWKSHKVGIADKVTMVTAQDSIAKRVFLEKTARITTLTPVRGSKKSEQLTIQLNAMDTTSAVIARQDSLKGPVIGKLKVASYPKLQRKLGIIYINEENDDVQVVRVGTKTASPKTACVRAGRNKFLDTRPAAGDLVVYDPVTRDSVIIAGRDSVCNTRANNTNTITKKIPGTLAGLKSFMNKVYGPANIEFTAVDTIYRLNANFDLNKDGKLDDNGGFNSREYLVLQDSARNKVKAGDRYDYYLLVTDNSTNAGLYGMGQLRQTDPKKYRYVLIISDSHYRAATPVATFYNTVAHEVGHGVFDLQHPFHETDIVRRGYTRKGIDPANFMDYQDGVKSRKYQWNQMHINDKIRKYGK